MTDHQYPGDENAGHEIEGPTCKLWNCKTWKKTGQCWMHSLYILL